MATVAEHSADGRLILNLTPALIARFKQGVDKGEPDECWNWTRAFRNGYGAIKHEGRVFGAHVVAYVLAHGQVPEGMIVGHSCDNSGCCNPNHTESITRQKNNADAVERGQPRPNGEAMYNAKLNETTVARIWALHRTGLGARLIARQLDLNENMCKRVLSKRGWKHLVPSWAK